MIFRFLFERPYLLLAVLVAVQFGLIAVWSWRRTRAVGVVVWIGFAAVVVLPSLSILVVTSRERIEEFCRELAELVERGDVVAIERRLDVDFEAGGLSADEFVDRLTGTLSKCRVDNPRLRRFKTTLSGSGVGATVFDSTCRVRCPNASLDRLTVRWRVTLRQRGESWMVTSLDALPTALSPIRHLSDCFR